MASAGGRIFSIVYSDTGPTATFVKPSIVITGNNNLICVKVPCISEGLVKNLVIKQKAGSSVNFNFELLSSVVPFSVGEHANSTTASGTIDLYRIIVPGNAISAGGTYQLAVDNEEGYPFQNLDGNFTVNQRYVYLVINPVSGAGTNSKWDVLLTFEHNIY